MSRATSTINSPVKATPSIVELAQQIQSDTRLISSYLAEDCLPELSLAADAHPFFPGTGPPHVEKYQRPPKQVLEARVQARDACEKLMQLLSGATDHFGSYITLHLSSAAIQYLYHFRIAEFVPVEGKCTFQEVATKAGVDASQCSRVLRAAMTSGYFEEPEIGYVAHTAGSKLFLNPDLKDAVGYVIEDTFPAASKLAEAIEKYPASQETNETAWNLAHGTDLSVFQYFEKHPSRMERFMGAMRMMSEREGFDLKYLVEGYSWEALGKGLVVDVGGNFGHCSYAIAAAAPDLSFIVQDLDEVVQAAKTRRPKAQEEGKIKFEAHDFFEPQPIKNADVYLLRFICHDHSDKYAAKILANIVSAMGPTSRIIIMDGVLPPPGTLSRAEERRLRIMDMNMMISFNSGERELDGWKSLFKMADSRLGLRYIVTPPGSALSIMELDLRGPDPIRSPI
ncbi:hypothetical protein LTR93_006359 [Exophiala xenobiotica]|nr:hypothetical protein LTR93_006359 [Exophiala xenobiotica]KAK5412744.1 hypothetical protein LTR06_005715 [Exophiala xenobiotica]KAK5443210.1 hypothetical protein LTR18_005888 [Exophiala xenobiotica]